MIKKLMIAILSMALVFGFSANAMAGWADAWSQIEMGSSETSDGTQHWIDFPESGTTPSDPASSHYRLYFRSSGLFWSNSSGTETQISSSSSLIANLDDAYDGGYEIAVDGSPVTLTGTATSNDTLLISKSSGSGDAIQITNAGTGSDIKGTSDTWSVSKTGVAVFTNLTPAILDGDITFDGTYDILWDDSDSEIQVNDSAKISFGTSADFQFNYGGTRNELNVTGDDKKLTLGADGGGFDMYWATETSGDSVFFDEDNAKVLFTDVDIHLDDAADIILGTGSDWVIESDTAKTLEFIPATTDETSAVNIGANSAGADLKVFGAAAGAYWLLDASANEAIFEGVDLGLQDDDIINFGNSNDVTMTYAGTGDVFQIDGSGKVIAIGQDGEGMDIIIYSETAGVSAFWDETNDNLDLTGVTTLYGTGSDIIFGHDSDFVLGYDDDNDLLVLEGAGKVVNIGKDGDAPDVYIYTETAGDYVFFDEDNTRVDFEDVDIRMMDDTTITFGDDNDITIQYDEDGNNVLQITGSVKFDNTVNFGGGQTRKVKFLPKEIELDGTSAPTLTDHGTDGQTNISALQLSAAGDAESGDSIFYISWHVPDGYVVDSARMNIAYTFSTAEDANDEAQFDFTVNAVAPGETLDAAGTALADQTTVIADASTGNAKLYVSQYNIEVEDIAVDDLVTIQVAVDESASALANSGFLLVLYVEIEWESTE